MKRVCTIFFFLLSSCGNEFNKDELYSASCFKEKVIQLEEYCDYKKDSIEQTCKFNQILITKETCFIQKNGVTIDKIEKIISKQRIKLK